MDDFAKIWSTIINTPSQQEAIHCCRLAVDYLTKHAIASGDESMRKHD